MSQHCLNCSGHIQRLEAKVGYMENELAAAVEGQMIESANRMRAERTVRRLKRELNGSTTPETQIIKQVCALHDEAWKNLNERARGLEYPMDGANAAAVRKWVRRDKDLEWFRRVIGGAFLSEFHRKKPSSYLTLASILGDENKTQRHLERYEESTAAEKLDRGLRLIKDGGPADLPIDVVLRALESVESPWAWSRDRWVAACPVCRGMLSVVEDEKSWVQPVCSSGCDLFEILDAVGLEATDLVRVLPDLEEAA